MKKLFVLFVLLSISISFLSAQDFKWHTWEEGYEKAKTENKPIYVFVHADWCHMCKRMLDKTFSKEEVQALIQKDYIAVMLDTDSKEKYKLDNHEYGGIELMLKLTDNKFRALPSSVFVDIKGPSGVLEEGLYSVDEMKTLLAKHKKT